MSQGSEVGIAVIPTVSVMREMGEGCPGNFAQGAKNPFTF